jgi:hypothetical protein
LADPSLDVPAEDFPENLTFPAKRLFKRRPKLFVARFARTPATKHAHPKDVLVQAQRERKLVALPPAVSLMSSWQPIRQSSSSI